MGVLQAQGVHKTKKVGKHWPIFHRYYCQPQGLISSVQCQNVETIFPTLCSYVSNPLTNRRATVSNLYLCKTVSKEKINYI